MMSFFWKAPVLAVLIVASTLELFAVNYAVDTANKRVWLVNSLRRLGPLPPDDWGASHSLYVRNLVHEVPLLSFVSIGNFRYDYSDPPDFHYRYSGPGVYTATLPNYANRFTYFAHFGLRELEVEPYLDRYFFALVPDYYNVAGLRYQGLRVVVGRDQDNTTGWSIVPGQSFFTTVAFDEAITFDLQQVVETPSFQVRDYWFGIWPNYPVDSKLPQPQESASLSSGALFVGGIHQYMTNRVWVQEDVYRPEFQLPQGHTVSPLSTYMEQYLINAWAADAESGEVPRTSEPNWNGVGKIDGSEARPTGRVSNGYYYRPTEFGKAVLTTSPQENGFYGEVPAFCVGLLVDRNRDGVLSTNDVTSSASPHVFWVNNDSDRPVWDEKNLWDELDVTGADTDANYLVSRGMIPSKRDLEDFDRLHFRGFRELARDLPGNHRVKLRWKTVLSGDPGIYVFQAAETNGGMAYLTNLVVATAQTNAVELDLDGQTYMVSTLRKGLVSGSLPLDVHTETDRGESDYFIYCGVSRGIGELAASVYRDDVLIGEATVWLDLRDVKELYERWTAGEPSDWRGSEPSATVSIFGEGLPSGVSPTAFLGDEEQPYILFVHSWNMDPDSKDHFAETAFKRLYWQGYTNRFGAFRWPTAYNQEEHPADLVHFNRSEFYAWKSGEALRSLLISLGNRYPGEVYLLAHSMGNVTAGEALALNAEKYAGGQLVKVYAASQAAVSLHAYNGANDNSAFKLNFQIVETSKIIYDLDQSWRDVGSGVIDLDTRTLNLHYNWLATNALSCARRVNFYNANDYALSAGLWELNQMIKPGFGGYLYLAIPDGRTPRVIQPGVLPPPTIPLDLDVTSLARTERRSRMTVRFLQSAFAKREFGRLRGLDWKYELNDMYEALAFCSESRVRALGAAWDVDALDAVVDLHSVWPPDTEIDNDLKKYGRHKWHSGQFRMNNMLQFPYWRELLQPRGFQIFE